MFHSNKKSSHDQATLVSYDDSLNQKEVLKLKALNRYDLLMNTCALSIVNGTALKKAIFISSLSVLSASLAINAHAAAPNERVINESIKEQQHLWQNKIQQQRIEALRHAQPTNTANDNTNLTVADEMAATNTKTNTQETQQTEAPVNNTAKMACLAVQQIVLGDMKGLDTSIQTQLRAQAAQLSQQLVQQTDAQQNNASDATVPINCISVTKANELVRKITKAYLDTGYFKITITPKTVTSEPVTSEPTSMNIGNPYLSNNATSIWNIHVATIKSIDNQTTLPTKRLFGSIVGKPANIAWLDQAVSNGERLIDGLLLLDIYPVGNDLRVKVSQQGDINTLEGDMEWRYDPDDSYGHHQIKLHTTLRNVLGQADVTSLSLQQSLTDNYSYDEDNQRRSASIYSIIPNGRWQWSGLLAADDHKNTTILPNSVLTQTGNSWQANIRSDFTLKRDQDSITTLYGQIAHQDVTSEILGSQIDNQSPMLSSGRLGASYTKLFNKQVFDKNLVSGNASNHPTKTITGAWVLDLSGEKAFGGHDNPATKAGLSDDYWRWLLSGYLTHQHSIESADSNAHQTIGYWQMTHELQGQYSDATLFGVTRQSLGSLYSGVRGIGNAANVASSGITLRNTLSYEPLQSKWKTFGLKTALQTGSHTGSQKVRWSPYVGLDYGVVKYADRINGDDTSDAKSGTIGLKLTGYDIKGSALDKRWKFDVSASRARVDYADSLMDGTQDTEVSAVWQWYF